MGIKKSPCYSCADRTIGCHQNCEEYKIWRRYQHDVKYQMSIMNNPPGCSYFKEKLTENGVKKSKKKYR